MFGLDFLYRFIKSFLIGIFFLQNLEISLDESLNVFFVTFKWVLEYMDTQIDLF